MACGGDVGQAVLFPAHQLLTAGAEENTEAESQPPAAMVPALLQVCSGRTTVRVYHYLLCQLGFLSSLDVELSPKLYFYTVPTRISIAL